MFKKPFSFKGRIRRSEFGITMIIFTVVLVIIQNIVDMSEGPMYFLIPVLIALLWFLLAQGAKRSHDMGDSGWYQIIPFYIFWMHLADSDHGVNRYGENPKD